MSVAKCPHCQDEVRIPPVNSESIVRCPLCQEEYKLADALKSLPPELIVVEQPGLSGDAIVGSSVVLTRGAGEVEPAAPFKFEESKTDDEKADSHSDEDSTPAPLAVVTSSRRKKEGSPLAEMLKIVAGGFIGIALAQLILWWLPPSWAKDPFTFGPTAAKYVPWIVPEQFRGGTGESSSNRDNSDENALANLNTDDDGIDLRQLNQRLKNLPPDGDVAKAIKQLEDEAKRRKKERTQASQKKDKSSGPPPADLGVKNAPTFTAKQVRDSWVKARLLNTKWTNDRRRTDQLFTALAELGTRVTFIDMNDEEAPAAAENVRRLLRTLSESPQRLQALSNRTPHWFNESGRSGSGVLLYGKIKSIKQSGHYYDTRVDLYSDPKSSVTVVSVSDPAQARMQENDSVLILGSIVETPESNLVAYKAQSTFVVYGGYPLVVGPPPAALGSGKATIGKRSAKKVPVQANPKTAALPDLTAVPPGPETND